LDLTNFKNIYLNGFSSNQQWNFCASHFMVIKDLFSGCLVMVQSFLMGTQGKKIRPFLYLAEQIYFLVKNTFLQWLLQGSNFANITKFSFLYFTNWSMIINTHRHRHRHTDRQTQTHTRKPHIRTHFIKFSYYSNCMEEL